MGKIVISDKQRVAAAQNTRERDYWLNQLAGEWVKSAFPADVGDTGGAGKSTARIDITWHGQLLANLLKLSNGYDTVLHMILVAGVTVLLHKYCGSKDIIISSPIYKQETDAEFINTVLALRNTVHDGMTFKELLLQVKNTITEADKHQNYPIEAILHNLDLESSTIDFPLFETAVLLANIHDRHYIRHIPLNIIISVHKAADHMAVGLEYNPALYKETTARRIANHLSNVLNHALSSIDTRIPNLEVLSPEEKKRIVYEFNDSAFAYTTDKTLHWFFEEQAVKTPDNTAVICDDRCITYRTLNERSNRLGWLLTKKGIGTGSYVGVVIDRTVEMVTAVMGIIKAGAAYVPQEPDLPEARIGRIMASLNVKCIISNPPRLPKISEIAKKLDWFPPVVCLDQDAYAEEIGDQPLSNVISEVTSGDIAYVIHTSGSTGTPKGVVEQHRPVVNVVEWVNRTFGVGPADKILCVASLGFDLSVYDIFGLLASGGSISVVSGEKLRDPYRLLEAIYKEGITFWDSAPAALQQLVPFFQSSGNFKKKNCFRLVFLSGDWIPVTLPDRLRETFEKVKVVALGGGTEATIWSNNYPVGIVDPAWPSIPYGKPMQNAAYYILDPHLQPCPIGVPGDLFIGGQCLALGYINEIELTTFKFIDNPFVKGEKIYRAGDMARWFEDGNMEFLGRKDFQVKIRGHRIELGEIEAQLLKHEDIKTAIVITRDAAGKSKTGGGKKDKYLCAYYVSMKELDGSQLKTFLARELPEYMIPPYFIKIDRIPLSPSGKLDRKALPEPGISEEQTHVAPRNGVDEVLTGIWAELLNIPRETISIDRSFFDLGGHSLTATELVSIIHQRFNKKIPLVEIFKFPTIRQLSDCIADLGTDRFDSIEPVEKKFYYRLSSAQKRFYVLQHIEKGVGYNIPMAVSLEGVIDRNKLESIFTQLIARHESLRTSFHMSNEAPVQVIHDEVPFVMEYTEIPAHPVPGETHRPIVEAFVRPFDLSCAPLIRTGLVKVKDRQHILMVDMHHIISDGLSMGVLVNEFMMLYQNLPLPPLRLQYKDFAEWENSDGSAAVLEKQESFWLKQFALESSPLDLPLDYKRPPVQSYEGMLVFFEIDRQATAALRDFAQRFDCTMYMMLSALFDVLLARLGNRDDIVVGTPIAGRRHVDLRSIIGLFINTLAMRNFPGGEKPFSDFLQEVKVRTLEAFENQEYHFEDLVARVVANRDVSRNPLFDVMFTMDPNEIQSLEIGGLTLKPYEYEYRISKFDMTWTGMEINNQLRFYVEYCTRLYKQETIHRFFDYFKRLINGVLENPEIKLCALEFMSEQEKRQLLIDFNSTRRVYSDIDKPIQHLFEEQVEKAPDHIALAGDNSVGQVRPVRLVRPVCLTYRELNEKSNQLAQWLQEKGVTTDTIVGVMMERSLELMIGLMGVLKAGGAYLPIDPEFPQERVDYMLKDSGAKLLVNEKFFRGRGAVLQKSPPCISNLAYVIYTSGSTGRPKGVMVEHRGVVNFMNGVAEIIDFSVSKTIAALTTVSFDIFVLETFLPLCRGMRVVMAGEKQQKDMDALNRLLVRTGVTMLQATPSMVRLMLHTGVCNTGLGGLKEIMVGGEPLPETLLVDLQQIPGIRIYNMYGPTETTVWSTVRDLTRDSEVTVGRPIANTQIYILDSHGKLQPPGVVGELCIAGDGLARGYLNRPELTVEKFNRSYRSYKTYILYKTGDLARWLPDGSIQCLGRMDSQVKIRGFRIELGEIETQLLSHPMVKEVVVNTAEDRGDKYLCAYYVTDAGVEPSTDELREYLSTVLPQYAIPSYFMRLDRIPLNTAGKVDRKALPTPGVKPGVVYAPPRSDVEHKLVDIWKSELDVEMPGIHDNFFSIGGDSIKAIKLVNTINKTLDTRLEMLDLYHNGTIEKIAAKIKRHKAMNPLSAVNRDEDKKKAAARLVELKNRVLAAGKLKEDPEDIYPMSDIELGMVFYWLKDTHFSRYHNQFVYQLKLTAFDPGIFKRALDLAAAKHSILRTAFNIKDFEEPVQLVFKTGAVDFEHYDIQGMTKNEQENHIRRLILEDRRNPFDINVPPLWRVRTFALGHDRLCLVLIFHHAILDGWSNASLMTELNNTYLNLIYNKNYIPGNLKVTYKDFIIEQLVEKAREETGGFWKNELAGYKRLDFLEPANEGAPDEIMVYSYDLGMEMLDRLNDTAFRFDTGIKHLCFAAYAYMMSMYSFEKDMVVGLVTSVRPFCEDGDQLLGCFLNTLPVRVKIPVPASYSDYIRLIHQKMLELTSYERLSLYEIMKVTGKIQSGRNPLFDVLFNYVDFHVYSQAIPGNEPLGPDDRLDLEGYENTNTLFDFTVNRTNDQFSLFLSYSRSVLKNRDVEELCRCFAEILNRFTREPDALMDSREFMPVEERERLLYTFNDTAAGYPVDATIHGLFERRVREFPGRVAVVSGAHVCSYGFIDGKAGQLAQILRAQGVNPDTIVALLQDRSEELIISIFGILKAGGAYLPIDPDYPEDRIQYMLQDSGARILVNKSEIRNPKFETNSNDQKINVQNKNSGLPLVLNFEHLNFDIVSIFDIRISNFNSSNLAYIIYTSGSTGKPKGVLIEHRNVVRLMTNDKFQFDFNNRDVWTMFHSVCFDFSVWEMYGALLYGGKLIVIPKLEARDTMAYLKILKAQGVTVLNQTPSAFYNLIGLELKEPGNDLKLRYIVFGGEALSPGRLKEWKGKYPGTKLVNMYGITETTVHVTYKEIGDEEIETGISNIGKPIPTLSAYVLDRDLHLLPVGIVGELCIGGDGVGRGYLNRPGLTAEKFIPVLNIDQSKKLYRSGDSGRWLPDGDLEYCGRIDRQVKIRGFRIEAGEIESCLLKYNGINDAVVVDCEKSGHKYLAAYFTGEGTFAPGQLRDHLLQTLPDYMVPAFFVQLEKIPLTPNGKVDRGALPLPEANPGQDYVPPTGELEEKLVELWKKELAIEKVGIKDSFFDLGGDSIKAIRLASAINNAFNRELKIADLYTHDTIETLAQKLGRQEYTFTGSEEELKIKKELEELRSRILTAHPDKEEIEDIYPMSDVEKGIAYYYLKDIGHAMYHDQFVYPLKYKDFDIDYFEKALALMVAKHANLRSGYNMENFEQPVKIVYRQVPLKIWYEDISRFSPAEQKAHIEGFMEQDRGRPFNHLVPPLWRMAVFSIGNENILFLFIFHHVLLDGWSNASLLTELNNTYLKLKDNPSFVPGELKSGYKDFVIEEIFEKQKQESIEYWKKELQNYKRLDLLSISSSDIKQRKTYTMNLGASFLEEVKNAARRHHTGLKHLCFGVYAYIMSIFSRDNDIVVGLATNTRTVREDGEKVVGCFLNMLPVRLKIPGDITWAEYIALVDAKMTELKKHERVSFFEIIGIAGEKTIDRNPIFDVLFTHLDFHVYGRVDTGGDQVKIDNPLAIDKFENSNTLLDLIINTTLSEFEIIITYSVSALSDHVVKQVAGYFESILKAIMENPDSIITTVKMEPAAFADQIPGLLEAKPDNVAIEFQF